MEDGPTMMSCPYCGNTQGGDAHRHTWVSNKVGALQVFHPQWLREGVLYVAECLYYDAYGQTGDEIHDYESEPPDEEGTWYYAEWLRKTHRDQ